MADHRPQQLGGPSYASYLRQDVPGRSGRIHVRQARSAPHLQSRQRELCCLSALWVDYVVYFSLNLINSEQCTHHQMQQSTVATFSTKPTATRRTWPSAQCFPSTGHRVCAEQGLELDDDHKRSMGIPRRLGLLKSVEIE